MVGPKLPEIGLMFGVLALIVGVVLSDEGLDRCLGVVVDLSLEVVKQAIQLDCGVGRGSTCTAGMRMVVLQFHVIVRGDSKRNRAAMSLSVAALGRVC